MTKLCCYKQLIRFKYNYVSTLIVKRKYHANINMKAGVILRFNQVGDHKENY